MHAIRELYGILLSLGPYLILGLQVLSLGSLNMADETLSVHRVGIGTDLHRLGADRRLFLGGVLIEYPQGLIGHSDCDVVMHALIDALLGAAGLGDIGEKFPDQDPAYKDADSGKLLQEVMQTVREAGYAVVNADVIVHAEVPRLSPYKAAMRENLAELLGVAGQAVNVKAKTGEQVDAVGQKEAIACTAIVGLAKI